MTRRCPEPVGMDKPHVWRDDDGWRCTQSVRCPGCGDMWTDEFAEETDWDDAMSAAANARPLEDD